MNSIYIFIFFYFLGCTTCTLPALKTSNDAGSPVERSIHPTSANRSDPIDLYNVNKQKTLETERSGKGALGCGLEKKENEEEFVGSNLFEAHFKKCFLPNDIALLVARRDFELLLPKEFSLLTITDQSIANIILYFHVCHKKIMHVDDLVTRQLCQRAFYDVLGGYLQFYLVPAIKQGFYRGRVSLETVENILVLYQQCKITLNSAGMGWKSRSSFGYLKRMEIRPLKIQPPRNLPSCCADLVLLECNDADNDQVIVSMPKLEPEDKHGQLANAWLPIKRKHIFNLRAPLSAYIFAKFYRQVTGCYEFQGKCQTAFDLKFMSWITEYIECHLNDEQFYPGFGAILSVKEHLRRRPKKDVESIQHSTPKEISTQLEDYSKKRGCGHKKKTNKKKKGKCKSKAMGPKTFEIIKDGSKVSKPTAYKGPSAASSDSGGSIACLLYVIYGFIIIGIILAILYFLKNLIRKLLQKKPKKQSPKAHSSDSSSLAFCCCKKSRKKGGKEADGACKPPKK